MRRREPGEQKCTNAPTQRLTKKKKRTAILLTVTVSVPALDLALGVVLALRLVEVLAGCATRMGVTNALVVAAPARFLNVDLVGVIVGTRVAALLFELTLNADFDSAIFGGEAIGSFTLFSVRELWQPKKQSFAIADCSRPSASSTFSSFVQF